MAPRKKPAAIGVKAPFPGFIEPALATAIGSVPGGERWIHEIKFDGYRVQVHLANEAAKVFTPPRARLDQPFQEGRRRRLAHLYLNGYDLRKLPLIERKAHLKKLIAGTALQFSDSFETDGREIYKHACQVGLEGIVSKVRDSVYRSGRGNDWVKKTCAQRETLTIAGFALDGKDWDGIYLGRRKGGDLVYAGKVDHGFDKTSVAELRRRLTPLIRKTQPYAKRIAHKATWVAASRASAIWCLAISSIG